MPIRIPSQPGRSVLSARLGAQPATPSAGKKATLEERFVTGSRVAARRLVAEATTVELERDPSSRTGKRARVRMPLAGLDLGTATLKSVSLGLPWRLEVHPGGPLPITVRGAELVIYVPDVLEGWSRLPPCLFVASSDGRFSMVTLEVRAFSFDDTDPSADLAQARGRQGLLHRTAGQLRAALAAPVESASAARASLGEARAQLARTQRAIGELNQALSGATPQQRTLAALLLAEEGQPLVQLHDSVLDAQGRVAHLRDNLATMSGLVPRGELAAAEEELAQATLAARQLETALGAAVDAVLQEASPEQVAVRASMVLGGAWAPWASEHAADVKDVAFWEGVVQTQQHGDEAARALMQEELKLVDQQLAEGQRTIDALAERLRARDVPFT